MILGNTEIAVYNNKWCAKKTKENNKVEIINYEEVTCKLEEENNIRTFTEQMESTSTEVMSNDTDQNLRYVGVDPNNYIKFNNEFWRIIGVFEDQTKIIREEPYSTSIAWDKDANNGGHGVSGYNDWSTFTLQVELNTTFLDSIDSTSKAFINQNYTWKLGGWDTPSITRDVIYKFERGTTVYADRPTEWIGAIGLLYPSDYGYATSSIEEYCNTTNLYDWALSDYDDCKARNWLYDSSNYQWTITPGCGREYGLFYLSVYGRVNWDYAYSFSYAAKPVLYLKSTVKIKSGRGTKELPFELIQ